MTPLAGRIRLYASRRVRVMQRRVDDPRITRSSAYTGRLYVHQFRISAPSELDDEFAGWIHEAYQVGNGAHLGEQPPHGGLRGSRLT